MIDPAIIKAAQQASLDNIFTQLKVTKQSQRMTIPPSVTIAQYGLESGWGKDMPAGSNNPFGIKALSGQPYVWSKTHEFLHGRYVTITAPFRKFDSLEQAFSEHTRLLADGLPYLGARQMLPSLRDFVVAMAREYATDPMYADHILKIIQEDGLQQYDKLEITDV